MVSLCVGGPDNILTFHIRLISILIMEKSTDALSHHMGFNRVPKGRWIVFFEVQCDQPNHLKGLFLFFRGDVKHNLLSTVIRETLQLTRIFDKDVDALLCP